MTAPAKQQWRIVFASGERSGVAFLDAATEQTARAQFSVMFPSSRIVSVALEAQSPCAAYERKAGL